MKSICKNTFNGPVEATIQLIGGKYKAVILWHLMNQTLRYNEIHKRIPNATDKMLAQQLRELEKDGLINRTVYPVVPPKTEYSLTDFGCGLLAFNIRDLAKVFVEELAFVEEPLDVLLVVFSFASSFFVVLSVDDVAFLIADAELSFVFADPSSVAGRHRPRRHRRWSHRCDPPHLYRRP